MECVSVNYRRVVAVGKAARRILKLDELHSEDSLVCTSTMLSLPQRGGRSLGRLGGSAPLSSCASSAAAAALVLHEHVMCCYDPVGQLEHCRHYAAAM